ncbi:hypothetical protein AHAS_Ahas06G0187700 [Arachis hypogaea]
MEVINETLVAFCDVLGLRINASKTSILFSRNVEQNLREKLVQKSGYKEVPCLGRYLDAMITNNRKGNDNFKCTLERVKKKLSGWKASCLSFAGRITLAQSAFFMKVVWRLFNEQDSLWTYVLYSKYGRSLNLIYEMRSASTDSQFWKSVVKITEEVRKNISFSVGDGRTIRFWKDVWIRGEPPLIEILKQDSIQEDMRVREFITREGTWDIQRLREWLPATLLKKIHAILPPRDERGSDSIVWTLTHDGNFSVRSAYYYLTPQNSTQDQV